MKPILYLLYLTALFCCGSSLPSRAESEAMKLLEPPEIAPTELSKRITAKNAGTLLFDTRSRVEYDVSHLTNAIWLDPTTTPERFIELFGPKAKGSQVVFYCTMSLRSVGFAANVMDRLDQIGVRRVAVLKGGIIGWANEDLVLVDYEGPTKFVHPFNNDAVNSLKQPELARFVPRQ